MRNLNYLVYLTCRQSYAFFSKPPRKPQEICKLSANYLDINYNQSSPCGPIPQNMAMALKQHLVSPATAWRSHPVQSGETFDGPPTLERSGSERRGGAVTSPLPEEEGLGEKVEPSLERGFLSPGNGGTEGGVKTIEG